MIYETISVISTMVLLIASLFVFYLQTRFTKGFMKKFVANSAICFFLILSERFLDMVGEFIFGTNNILYHLFSVLLILGAVIMFYKAINALKIIKKLLPEEIK